MSVVTSSAETAIFRPTTAPASSVHPQATMTRLYLLPYLMGVRQLAMAGDDGFGTSD